MNELVKNENTSVVMNGGFIEDLTNANSEYCSFVPSTFEEKIKLTNAIQNPDGAVADKINEIITIKNVVIQVIELTNEKTGEIQNCPRTILIDDKGKAWQAVSIGVYNALKNIMYRLGQPSEWGENGLKLKVKQIKKGEKNILTFEVIA